LALTGEVLNGPAMTGFEKPECFTAEPRGARGSAREIQSCALLLKPASSCVSLAGTRKRRDNA